MLQYYICNISMTINCSLYNCSQENLPKNVYDILKVHKLFLGLYELLQIQLLFCTNCSRAKLCYLSSVLHTFTYCILYELCYEIYKAYYMFVYGSAHKLLWVGGPTMRWVGNSICEMAKGMVT